MSAAFLALVHRLARFCIWNVWVHLIVYTFEDGFMAQAYKTDDATRRLTCPFIR